MPRLPRLDLPGIPQHIVQRGNDRQPCFYQPADYLRYLTELRELSRHLQCAIHAYVLMTNHVHLLVTPAEAGAVPRLMQSLGRRASRIRSRRSSAAARGLRRSAGRLGGHKCTLTPVSGARPLCDRRRFPRCDQAVHARSARARRDRFQDAIEAQVARRAACADRKAAPTLIIGSGLTPGSRGTAIRRSAATALGADQHIAPRTPAVSRNNPWRGSLPMKP